MKGSVKFFDEDKGYGFIRPDGASKDIFVHISAVEKSEFSALEKGQRIEFDVVPGRKGEQAENLRPE